MNLCLQCPRSYKWVKFLLCKSAMPLIWRSNTPLVSCKVVSCLAWCIGFLPFWCWICLHLVFLLWVTPNPWRLLFLMDLERSSCWISSVLDPIFLLMVWAVRSGCLLRDEWELICKQGSYMYYLAIPNFKCPQLDSLCTLSTISERNRYRPWL